MANEPDGPGRAASLSAADAQRLRQAQLAMSAGLGGVDRAKTLFDRLSWIVWGVLVLFIGGVAVTYLVR